MQPVGTMLDLAEEIDPRKCGGRWAAAAAAARPLPPFPWRSCPVRPWVQQAARLAGPRAPHVAGAVNRRLGPPRSGRRIVEALAAFCERNGAALVVKSRLKDPSPKYLRRVAMAHFDEGQEGYHPPLTLRLLRCAALCVHFYSAVVVESLFCGVPSLCLGPAPEAMGLDRIPHATQLYHGREGGLYNWPGAAHWRALDGAAADLARAGLGDFPLEPSPGASNASRLGRRQVLGAVRGPRRRAAARLRATRCSGAIS
jgi:hypothetical protein